MRWFNSQQTVQNNLQIYKTLKPFETPTTKANSWGSCYAQFTVDRVVMRNSQLLCAIHSWHNERLLLKIERRLHNTWTINNSDRKRVLKSLIITEIRVTFLVTPMCLNMLYFLHSFLSVHVVLIILYLVFTMNVPDRPPAIHASECNDYVCITRS